MSEIRDLAEPYPCRVWFKYQLNPTRPAVPEGVRQPLSDVTSHHRAMTFAAPHAVLLKRLFVAVVALPMLSACLMDDGIEQSGRAGLTVDEKGRPVPLLHVCGVDVREVLVFHTQPEAEDRASGEDVRVAVLERSPRLKPGRYELPLADPGSAGWKPAPPVDLSVPAVTYGIGGSDGVNGSTDGIEAPSAAIAKLDDDKVLVGSGTEGSPAGVLTRSEFDTATCDDVEYVE